MSVQAEVQKLLRDTLFADTAVMALVDGVHDQVPSEPFGAKQAYIALGPSYVTTDDADCIDGAEIVFQLDAWSRSQGKVGCRKIVDAIKDALHQKDLELTENALVEIDIRFRNVVDDPDGQTKHGIVEVTVVAEEK
jgi:Protein of unknown function (DUF3168)